MRQISTMKLTLAAAAMSAGLALAGTAASAAPGSVGGIKADAQTVSPVEKTSYSCWWQHGRRYCRRDVPTFGFYIGQPRRYGYYGHRRWY
jgi:nitrous oxide reductase